MTKLLPKRYEVQLIYECDNCGCEHWCSIEESVFPAGIKCYCGKNMRLEPIDNTRLILSPKNKRVKKKKQEQKPSHDGSKMLDDLVSALVNLGYKKTESVKKAKEAMSHYSTLDECLKFALGT
tara:strand:- start:16 stop:384 length:369 start_codon:yes stop_codon:yes gene_type:complete